MNIFKSTRYTWWQLGMLKWAVLLFGIVIGAHWPEIFAPYEIQLLLLTIVLGAYGAVIWSRGK